MTDVFVSYSREDCDFVRELHTFLTGAGRDVWVDWEDIPAASEWERDINDSIDGAESFVCVVSTHSLVSEYCAVEFRYAQERGKRIVPIACDAADPEAAQAGLRQLNWIWCRADDDREAAFAKLSGALDTDLEWARAHTRLLVRAVDWESGEDSSLLLRGRDLANAEREIAANAGKEPTPTELQQRYVFASRHAATTTPARAARQRARRPRDLRRPRDCRSPPAQQRQRQDARSSVAGTRRASAARPGARPAPQPRARAERGADEGDTTG